MTKTRRETCSLGFAGGVGVDEGGEDYLDLQ